MVNSQLITQIINAFKLDMRVDKIPNATPTVEVNPKIIKSVIVKSGAKTTTGGFTLLATPLNQDVFLKTISFGMVKDVTCDVAINLAGVSAVIDGVTTNLLSVPMLTLTAQDQNKTINFGPAGIKIDRNSNILIISNTYAAGLMNRTAEISYFLDEVN